MVSSHHAIVKCDRYDVEWYFNDNSDIIALYKDRAHKDARTSINYYSLYNYNAHNWFDAILSHGVKNKLYNTGQTIIWSGIIEQERLRVGDHLYIPPLKDYKLINKVETTPDGKITYYVDYRKYFYDNGKESRLKAVDEWFEFEFPELNKFNQLTEHSKSMKDKFEEEYKDYKKCKDHKIESDLKSWLSEDDECNNYNTITSDNSPTKDYAWLTILGVVGLSASILITILLIITSLHSTTQ